MASLGTITGARGTGPTGAGVTNHFGFGSGFGGSAGATTEADRQTKIYASNTYRNLSAGVASNATSGGTNTFRLRKNGANGNLSVSIPTGTTGIFEDLSSSDSVAANDLVNFQLTVGTGGGLSIPVAAVNGDTRVIPYVTYTGSTSSTASSTNYLAPCSFSGGINATESVAQVAWKGAGTARDGWVYITTNGRSTTSTYRSRLNTANGGLSISISSGTTGRLEDVSGSDTLAAADLYCASIQLGTGSGNLTFSHGFEFTPSDTNQFYLGPNTNGTGLAAGVTNYYPLGGASGVATETQIQTTMHVAQTLSGLSIKIQTNGLTATSTGRTRINGANGNQSVSIGSGATGTFSDTTHSDAVVDGDKVDISIAAGGTGTNLSISNYVVVSQVTPAQAASGATISSGAALYAPTLVQVIVGATIAAAATLFAATVTPGAVTVDGATIASGAQVFEPSVVAGAPTIVGATITSTATLTAPTLAVGAVDVVGATIGSGEATYPPTITTGSSIAGATISSGASLAAPSIAVGDVTVTGASISSGAQLSAPSIAPGAVSVTGATINSSAQPYSPTVSAGAVAIAGAHISSAAALTAPAVELEARIEAATIATASTLFSPSVTGGAHLELGTVETRSRIPMVSTHSIAASLSTRNQTKSITTVIRL